jgi:Dolichyl-phosphate-mannose-protein mannosyltransferase
MRKLINSIVLCYIAIIAAALTLCLADATTTGALWPDGPRYANAGAMIHDWLLSSDLAHPYQFAVQNYCQYPSFNVPFHPPIYPGLLGLSFLLTGVSYFTARCFIALNLGVAGCFFFALLRRFNVERRGSLACTLLMLTTPQVVHWARDTMSEVPGFCLILAATWVFLLWLENDRLWYCWLAFALAQAAFLSRISTAGVIPTWFFFVALTGRAWRLINVNLLLCVLIYLYVSVCYVRFAAEYAQFEVSADGKARGLSSANFLYFTSCLPPALIWGTTLAALYGLVFAFRHRLIRTPIMLFWTSWICSYALFKVFVPTSFEIRHFFMAFPGLAGLGSVPFVAADSMRHHHSKFAWLILAAGITFNLIDYSHVPRGIVGYESVAACLASLSKPGNIMLNCWHDQDLIFRYRASASRWRRAMIRGDRTLAVRLPSYARKEAIVMAHSSEDVLTTVRKGRIRYLITCAPTEGKCDDRPAEMVLAHQVALEDSADFKLVGEFPIVIEFERGAMTTGTVFVWEVLGDLPVGDSELPVLVPTAGMSFNKKNHEEVSQ